MIVVGIEVKSIESGLVEHLADPATIMLLRTYGILISKTIERDYSLHFRGNIKLRQN